jgi:hypothetical protein
MSELTWTFARLDGLAPRDVFDLLKLRAEVFSVEQNCVFLDPDVATPAALYSPICGLSMPASSIQNLRSGGLSRQLTRAVRTLDAS